MQTSNGPRNMHLDPVYIPLQGDSFKERERSNISKPCCRTCVNFISGPSVRLLLVVISGILLIVLSSSLTACAYLYYNAITSEPRGIRTYRDEPSTFQRTEVLSSKNITEKLIFVGNSSALRTILSSNNVSSLGSVTWSGIIEPTTMVSLLTKATELRELTLENSWQELRQPYQYQNKNLAANRVPTVLRNLTVLTLKNITSSSGVIKELLQSTAIDSLEEIYIVNCEIDAEDAQLLEGLLLNSGNSLGKINFMSTSALSSISIWRTGKFPKATDLLVSVSPGTHFVVDESFPIVFPNLKVFTIKGSIPYATVPYILQLRHIQKLRFTCSVPRNINIVDLSFFRNAPKSFEYGEIAFDFEVKRYGGWCKLENTIDKNRKARLKTYCNC